MKQYVVVGCRNFGREIVCWLHDMIAAGDEGFVAGFIDDDQNALEGYSYDLPWLGTMDSYRPAADHRLILGVADPTFKERTVLALESKGSQFSTLIHPTSVVARSAKLGRGVVLCPHAVVSADARVAEFVILNCQAAVGHDVHVGAYSTVSSFVDLTGRTRVGARVFLGSGARLIPGTSVGDDAVVGAGATVVRDVPERVTVYAPPAKRL